MMRDTHDCPFIKIQGYFTWLKVIEHNVDLRERKLSGDSANRVKFKSINKRSTSLERTKKGFLLSPHLYPRLFNTVPVAGLPKKEKKKRPSFYEKIFYYPPNGRPINWYCKQTKNKTKQQNYRPFVQSNCKKNPLHNQKPTDGPTDWPFGSVS